MSPKEYWKIPRAWKRGSETPIILCKCSCVQRSQVPLEFSTWSNTSFSPKEYTGTKWALQGDQLIMGCIIYNWDLFHISSGLGQIPESVCFPRKFHKNKIIRPLFEHKTRHPQDGWRHWPSSLNITNDLRLVVVLRRGVPHVPTHVPWPS